MLVQTNNKKIVAVHDLSCIGRVSLNAVIPILTSMGLEVTPLPTAILSSHTQYPEYTFLDLTSEMRRIIANWKKQGFQFNAFYTGYLGSPEQVQVVSDLITDFRRPTDLIVVDPVLGDNGHLYKGMGEEMVEQMRNLVKLADVITPNMTEMFLLLGKDPATSLLNNSPSSNENSLKSLSGAASAKDACIDLAESRQNRTQSKVKGQRSLTGDASIDLAESRGNRTQSTVNGHISEQREQSQACLDYAESRGNRTQSMFNSQQSTVNGQQSTVNGQRSMFNSQLALDRELKFFLRSLSDCGPSIVIVTSVPVIDNPHLTSVYAYNRNGNRYWKVTCPFLPAHYPGTGDAFTSVITGSLLQGDSLPLALDRAMQFTLQGIRSTFGYDYSNLEGIMLEKVLNNLQTPIQVSSYELI